MFHALSKNNLSANGVSFWSSTLARVNSFTLAYAVLLNIGVVKERSSVVLEDFWKIQHSQTGPLCATIWSWRYASCICWLVTPLRTSSNSENMPHDHHCIRNRSQQMRVLSSPRGSWRVAWTCSSHRLLFSSAACCHTLLSDNGDGTGWKVTPLAF